MGLWPPEEGVHGPNTAFGNAVAGRSAYTAGSRARESKTGSGQTWLRCIPQPVTGESARGSLGSFSGHEIS